MKDLEIYGIFLGEKYETLGDFICVDCATGEEIRNADSVHRLTRSNLLDSDWGNDRWTCSRCKKVIVPKWEFSQ